MKLPENFKKIDQEKFSIGAYNFYLEQDETYNGYVFVFPGAGNSLEHCLWFQIDWNQNKYSVRKCELGLGTAGSDLILDEPFQRKLVITKTTFINNFIRETVDYLMANRLY